MAYPARSAKHDNLATMPYRKINVKKTIKYIKHLPGGQRIIICSSDGSFRVWDLEMDTQVGEDWKDKDMEPEATALSSDGKTVASGSRDGAVKLWSIDTGKVIKKWTGHAKKVWCVCWSSDGGRVVSGSHDGTIRVWDVESSRTISNLKPMALEPEAGERAIRAVCCSPNGKMIATADLVDSALTIWDANTGELLKTLAPFCGMGCLAWTLDGKTLIAKGFMMISKFDIATWTEIRVDSNRPEPLWNDRDSLESMDLQMMTQVVQSFATNNVHAISLSPNGRTLASTSERTVELWNYKTNRSIGTPLLHEDSVNCASFSVDGKLLVTGCEDGHIYTWNISTIVEKADLLSDNVDATQRPAPKIKISRRLPPGFFDDARDLSSTRTQPYGRHDRRTLTPHQRTLGRFPSFWRRSKSHRTTGHDTQPRSRPLSWTRNLASSIVRRRHRSSDIGLREPPIVEVPCTAGKPRNYHARKKKATSSSRPIAHNTQQPSGAAQNTPSSSQLPPPTATTSSLPAIAGTVGASGTISHPHVTVSGWRARFVGWICCMPIQHTDGQH